jgi:hypothetical protein
MAVLAGCVGVYLVLALGFHWFLQPVVKSSEAAAAATPPPATFVPDPDKRLAAAAAKRTTGPATPSVQSRREVAQRPGPDAKPPSSSEAKPAPVRAGEPARTQTAEQDAATPPKKEPKKKVARKVHDRPVRQAADPHNPWSFASSPGYGYSNYRPWF